MIVSDKIEYVSLFYEFFRLSSCFSTANFVALTLSLWRLASTLFYYQSGCLVMNPTLSCSDSIFLKALSLGYKKGRYALSRIKAL